MPRLRRPRLSFSLRALWVLVTLAALASAGAIRWQDAGQEFARQQAYCDDLIQTLGGERTLWIDAEVGVFCGSYSRPDGLEFVHESCAPTWATMYRKGLREITSVSVTHAKWNEIPDSPVRLAVFQRLSRLHSLRRLSIHIEGLNARELLPLAELSNIEEVRLEGLDDDTADEMLQILGRMSKLRELSIEFSFESFGQVNFPEELEFLSLRATAPAGRSPRSAAAPTSTSDDTHVDEQPPIDDEDRYFTDGRIPTIGLSYKGFAHLGRLPELRKLELGNAIILDAGLESLVSIRELRFDQCRIARAGYAGLAACREIVDLDMILTEVSNEAAAAIGHLPRLRKLFIFNSITDQQLAQICEQGRIEELTLCDVGELTKDGLKPLAKLPIASLSVSIHENPGPELLAGLSVVHSLRQLEIHTHDSTFAFLPALEKIKQLEELQLPGAKIPPKQLAGLLRALPNTKVGLGYGVNIDDALSEPDVEETTDVAESE